MTPTKLVYETVADWNLATEEEVSRGYKEMAADDEREREAFEWIEAEIGECL